MKRLFIEFLTDQGIVSAAVASAAIVNQLGEMPTVQKVVLEQALLPPEVLFRVFVQQAKKKQDFRNACDELGLWTPELDRRIREETSLRSKPLTEILVGAFGIPLERITKALDEFLAERQNVQETDGTNFDFGITPSNELAEYLEIFSEKETSSLISLIEQVAELNDGEELKAKIHEVQICVQALDGVGRWLKAPLTSSLMRTSIRLLSKFSASDHSFSAPQRRVAAAAIIAALEACSKLRSELRAKGTEKYFWESSEGRGMYESVIAKLQQAESGKII